MSGNAGSNIAKPLKSYIERIEKLAEEKRAIAEDITDIFREAKGNGFDPKTMRETIKLRALDAAEREEKEHLRDTYLRAMGLLPELDE